MEATKKAILALLTLGFPCSLITSALILTSPPWTALLSFLVLIGILLWIDHMYFKSLKKQREAD